jgi:hypothetical protein
LNKHILIIITFVLGIGTVLFADQVLAIFHGMSPLEAMQFIWSFVLHVAVTTIVGYVVVGLPKIVKPWLRMTRKQRRSRIGMQQVVSAPKMPRLNKDQLLLWMAEKLAKPTTKATTAQNSDEDRIRFKL